MKLSCITLKSRLFLTFLQDNEEHTHQEICDNLRCTISELCFLINNVIFNGLCIEIKKKLTSYNHF